MPQVIAATKDANNNYPSCAPCARDQFERPATVIVDGVPLCGRCDGRRRTKAAAVGAPLDTVGDQLPAPAPQASIDRVAEVAHARVAEIYEPKARAMSKADYLAKYGPSTANDIRFMVRDLKPDEVLVLPLLEGETVDRAVKRYRKMLGSGSGFTVEGSQTHRHVTVEKEQGG